MIHWYRDIERTASPRQVVALARDYLATLTPRDLARVPQRCRPSRIFDEEDIVFWSGRLTEEYWQLRGTAADAAILQELWSFFLRATIHIERLRESAGTAAAR
jgi:hypothetical protein